MHGQFLVRLCALAMEALAPAARLPIGTPVSAVAANQAGAVALTVDEVRMMDGSGAPLGRILLAPGRLQARRPHQDRGGGFAAAAGVVADGDFNDPHDADSEIEDPENILVEDDPPAARRRQAPVRSGDVALAVGGAFAWLGRDDGLWRLPFSGGSERVALPAAGPVRAVATSPDGRLVLVASERGLAWSEDAGARFEAISNGPARPRRLAVTSSRQAYALADGDVYRVHAGVSAEPLVRGATDLVACGATALALAQRMVIVLTGNASTGLDQRHDEGSPVPAGTRHLACTPAGDVWMAYGAGLWLSDDQGRSWIPRTDTPAAFPIAALAVTGLGLWVASAGGLMVLPLHPTSEGARRAPDVRAEPGVDVVPIPRQRWWLAALPRIDLGFATAQSNRRRDVRAFVLLSFAFEPLRSVRAERLLESETRAARGRAHVRRELVSSSSAGDRLDPIAAQEREAMLRLLED